MSKAKATPAVITALSLFVLLFAAHAAPAVAAGPGEGAREKAAALAKRGDTLHAQATRLARRIQRGDRSRSVVRNTVRLNYRVARLNAALTALTRDHLAADECDAADLASLLAANARAVHVSKDTLRLDRKALDGRRAVVSRKVTRSSTKLKGYDKKLRDKEWPPARPDSSPDPTPSPTPSGPAVPAGYTLVQNQTIHDLSTNNLSYRYYYKCTFTGGTSVTGVLHFGGTSSNLIFDSCTIARGPQNGITLNDAYGRLRDITFKDCLIKSQPRMGFECTSRPGTATTQWQRISVYDSTFEPQGNEAVSYDGGAAAGNATFSGNVIQGAGNDPNEPYGAGFEINGPSNMTVTNNRIYQCRGSLINLQRHTTEPCGWVFTDNVFDASVRLQATPMSSLSQVVLSFNVYGGKFARNSMTSASPGGSVAYLSNSHGMDWRTSTWRDASSRMYYDIPTQVKGCTGNLF